jgi:hypothetical protein
MNLTHIVILFHTDLHSFVNAISWHYMKRRILSPLNQSNHPFSQMMLSINQLKPLYKMEITPHPCQDLHHNPVPLSHQHISPYYILCIHPLSTPMHTHFSTIKHTSSFHLDTLALTIWKSPKGKAPEYLADPPDLLLLAITDKSALRATNVTDTTLIQHLLSLFLSGSLPTPCWRILQDNYLMA